MTDEKKNLIIQELRLWSSEVLEVSSPAFGGMPPCPYAAKTWQNRQYAIHFVDELSTVVELKAVLNELDLITHIVVWLKPESKTVEEFDTWLSDQNKNHFGIWLMGFHPDAEDNEMTDAFDGLVEDDYGLILVQSLGHLATASDILRRTNYYNNFPPDYMEAISDRQDAFDAWIEKTITQIPQEITFTEDEKEIEIRMH